MSSSEQSDLDRGGRVVSVEWPLIRCPECGMMSEQDMTDPTYAEPMFCNGVSYTMPAASMEFEQATGHPSTHEPREMERWTAEVVRSRS